VVALPSWRAASATDKRSTLLKLWSCPLTSLGAIGDSLLNAFQQIEAEIEHLAELSSADVDFTVSRAGRRWWHGPCCGVVGTDFAVVGRSLPKGDSV